MVKGFKTRLLLSPHGFNKTLEQIRGEILKTTGIGSKAMIIDVNDRITLKNLMKKRRLKVVEFIRQFQRIYNTQGIIVPLLKAKKKFEIQQRTAKTDPYSRAKVAFEDESVVVSPKAVSKPQKPTTLWPSQQKDSDNDEKEQPASFWPSLQKKEDSDEEPKTTLWPSQLKETSKEPLRKSKPKKAVVLQDFDDDEKQEDEVDWLSLPVKKQPEEKPAVSQEFEDRPIKPAKVNSFVNIDDMPVGGRKKNTEIEPEAGKISFGIR